MTYTDFEAMYWAIHAKVPDYRFGQMFIVMLIKDSSSREMQLLWNEWDFEKAKSKVLEIIERYHWDYEDLPIKYVTQTVNKE